jgi:hypothetical protein
LSLNAGSGRAGGVELPYALARKYPQADREWGWQYIYPADRPSIDPRSGARRRHHLDPSYLQKAVHAAICKLLIGNLISLRLECKPGKGVKQAGHGGLGG